MAYRELFVGDPAPWFTQRSTSAPAYRLEAAAGRHLLLCLFGSARDGHSAAAIAAASARTDLFDDDEAAFFGVSMDPEDEAGRVRPRLPGVRHFWDQDGTIGRAYGALDEEFQPGSGNINIRRRWVLLDPALRVAAIIPFTTDRSDIERALTLTRRAIETARSLRAEATAPVLMLPGVLEPSLCQKLIAYAKERDPIDSGFMVEESGRTLLRNDHSRKIRQDCLLDDDELQDRVRRRIVRRIVPEVRKAFGYSATRIERYLIGRYGAEDGGFFTPHRDNTTKGTAHRRFAVTIALSDDYEGGLLRFPEFGTRGYKPPAGGAVIFSCSLLHGVDPVTAGERFVFVPFLYDDEAAELRERNRSFLGAAPPEPEAL